MFHLNICRRFSKIYPSMREGKVCPLCERRWNVWRTNVCIFTARKRSCGKVMFLHLSVSHSVHRGGLCMMSLPVWQTNPPPDRHPRGQREHSKERAVRILLEYIPVQFNYRFILFRKEGLSWKTIHLHTR